MAGTVLTLGTVSPLKAREISLDETVMMARTQSVSAAVALNQLRTSYWSYRTYRADQIGRAHV